MKYIFTLVAFFFFSETFAQHKAGTVDSSFGFNGKSILVYQQGLLNCNGISKQSDDKIITVGVGAKIIGEGGFCALRFLKDGSQDSSFGDEGITFINFDYDYAEAYAVAVQPDDKIIVAGYAFQNSFDPEADVDYDIVIARLNANGSIDSTFGAYGKVTANYGTYDRPSDIAIQPDGKIIIQGTTSGSFYTLRYLPNGTLDESFGTNGSVLTNPGNAANAVILQPDGKIIVAGAYEPQIQLVRYTPDGKLDASFGNGGIVRKDITNDRDVATGIAIRPDGKIVVCGYSSKTLSSYDILMRFNGNGSLDESFGNNGYIKSKTGYSSSPEDIYIQDDGKIIMAGNTYDANYDVKIYISRYTAEGQADSLFATNGVVVDGYNASGGGCSGIVLQSDKKIVVAGPTFVEGKYATGLARYHNDDVTPPPTPIARIKRWLHKHGITWEDCPPSICDKIAGYAVQRSSNGLNWNTIFSGRRSPNNQQPIGSNYADPAPLPGTNYYRLQTTSVDGAVAYSNVIAIGDENSSISLSPNPAKNVLQITGLSSSGKTKIMVVDLSGNMAINPMLITNNTSSYNLSIVTLKPGNYMLRIETNGAVVTKQFVKD